MSGTTISVITVTRNCAGTVNHCLDSVAQQTYPHREHVVCDGASTDGTLDVLRRHGADFSKFVSEHDGGIYEALNKGLAMASGDVVGFLHADDTYADAQVLDRIAAAFENPDVGAVYGDLEYVSASDPTHVARRWRSSPFQLKLLARGWMPPHPTLYVRRGWYERIGGFDVRYRIAADYHNILRLFAQPTLRPHYIPEVLVRMRTGGASNRSLCALFRKSREDLDALHRTGQGGWFALAYKNLSKVGQFVATA